MATEINCSCEITENEVIICYPPISSGGGGGITGVAPVGNVPKVATVDTGDVILTLEESSIDDLAAGLSVIKSAAGGQYINLVVKNTDDDIDAQLNLISNNTANVYQANLFLTDQASTIGLTQDLDFLRWGYDTNGVDDIKVVIDKAALLMTVKGGSYTDGLLSADTASGVVKLGDIGNFEALAIIDSVSKTINLTIANIDYLQISEGLVIIGNDATSTFISIDDANGIYLEGVNIPLGTAGKIAINSSGYLYTDTSGGGGGTTTNPLTIGTGLSGTSFDGSAAVTIQNQLITGLAGGQTIISGTAATDKLIIKITTGNQTTGASNLVSIKSGNNGANELIRIGDGIGSNIGELSIWAAGQSSSSTHLLRAGTNFTYINAGTDLRLQVGAVNYINMLSGAGTVAIQKPVTFATGANVTLVANSTTIAPLVFTGGGTYKTTPAAGSVEYNGQFSMTPTDATRRFVTLAASSTKVTAAAPYTNDGYIVLNINGTDVHVMTTT